MEKGTCFARLFNPFHLVWRFREGSTGKTLTEIESALPLVLSLSLEREGWRAEPQEMSKTDFAFSALSNSAFTAEFTVKRLLQSGVESTVAPRLGAFSTIGASMKKTMS